MAKETKEQIMAKIKAKFAAKAAEKARAAADAKRMTKAAEASNSEEQPRQAPDDRQMLPARLNKKLEAGELIQIFSVKAKQFKIAKKNTE